MGPLPPAGLSATAWGLIGAAIALVVIIIIILLICYFCPDKARARKRAAAKKVRQIFEMPTKKKSNDSPDDTDRDWRSPAMVANQAGTVEREEVNHSKTPSVQGSERVYFGKKDIDEMTSGTRSENGSAAG